MDIYRNMRTQLAKIAPIQTRSYKPIDLLRPLEKILIKQKNKRTVFFCLDSRSPLIVITSKLTLDYIN